MSADIWVLGDNRPGNTNQAIALAEKIGLSYELKLLNYNIFRKLPSFILNKFPFHINKKNLKNLIFAKEIPKLIISAGRKPGAVALYLKEYLNKEIKIVQIMKAGQSDNKFDLLILPQHDTFLPSSLNVIRTIGALTNIQSKTILAGKELKSNYPEIKKFIAIIIGGNSKSYKYNEYEAIKFIEIILKIHKNHNLPFFISFSRRTPQTIKKIIKEKFLWPNVIYDPLEKKPNPYHGILANAEYIIVTADSISMCSDVASTGKPFYIYYPQNFTLKKHKFFLQQLLDLGIAKKLDYLTNVLINYSYKPLNEAEKIAEIIRTEILEI